MEIANIKCFSEGPDLRGGSLPVNTLYKPAYSRYTGNVYQQSGFEAIFPQIKGKMVLIVSALYGILEAGDYTRDYDLRMDESLLNGGHVSTWWRNHHLGSILEECILLIKPDTVHDLLPKVYRSALEPLPLTGLEVKGIRYEMYEYPGLGTGSQWRRGNDLKNLLITR